MATAIGDLVAKLGMDTSGFNKGALGSTDHLRKMGDAADHTTGSLRGMGVVAGATAAIVNKSMDVIVAGFRRGIRAARDFGKEGLDFNAAMRESLAIMPDVSPEMERRMRVTAFGAARETVQSPTAMARAYYYLASAGMAAEQSLAALPQVAKFAKAGMFDMQRSTSLLMDSLSALGMKVKDPVKNLENMTRLSDMLVKANTLANASVEQFAEGLAGPLAGALRANNRSVEEGIALLALLAERGQKSAEASEAGMILYRDIPRALGKNQAEWKKYGVTVTNVHGNMLSMASMLKNLTDRLAPLSDLERAVAMETMGLTRSVRGIVMKLFDGTTALHDYETELRNAGGTTERVFRKQLGPFEKGWNDLKVSVTEAGAAMMKWAGPILGNAFTGLAQSMTVLQQFLKTSPGFKAFVESSKNAFSAVVANMDVMLGSWDGFNLGMTYAAKQAAYGLEGIWEQSTHTFKTTWEKTKLWWSGFWGDMQGMAAKKTIPATAGFMEGVGVGREAMKPWIEEQRRASVWRLTSQDRPIPRPSSALTREERNAQINTGVNQTIASINNRRNAAEQTTRARLKELDKQHKANMAAINEKSLAATNLWNAQQSVLPNLSGKANKLWAQFKGPPPGTPSGMTPGRGAPMAGFMPGAGAVQGPNFAPAMEKGTAAAYSTIINAGRENEKVAKEQLRTQKRTLEEIKGIRREAKRTETVSIPRS